MIAQRYPEHFIAPMREELTCLGVQELRTPEAVKVLGALVEGHAQLVAEAVAAGWRKSKV